MRRLRMDHEAVSQTVAFVVGLSLFMGFLVTLIISSADSPDSSASIIQDTQNRLDAERIADMLASSPGIGWETGADNINRLGLVDRETNQLNAENMDKLRGAKYESDPFNGKVDYEEALESLGLPTDDRLGIHIRITPVGLHNQLAFSSLSHVKTSYIADWENTPRDFVVTFASDQAMVDDARAQIQATIGAGTQSERDTIVSLDTGFDNRVNLWGFTILAENLATGDQQPLQDALTDKSLMRGDIYIDDSQYLSFNQDSGNGLFEDSLPIYDLLIIGSTVQHSSLTSNNVKHPIADWTLAGGTLLVLGSESQNFQWLQPLFSVGTTTVNAAPSAPDVSHPMLHEPYELDWTSYDNFGLGWNLKKSGAQASYEKFQHIITSEDKDILAVSNEGAFGDGRVFLTAFRPEDIFIQQSPDEAYNFLRNIALFDDRSQLYLDYGPTPPEGAAVSAAIRTTHLPDPDLGMVNVRITVLYWGV